MTRGAKLTGVFSTREVPCRTSAETGRETSRRVRLSPSGRTPERTHRVGEREHKTLERVDRELQGRHRRGGVRRARRPGTRRRAAGNRTARRTYPREQSRPSRTVSHQRARAGENTTDPRNQSHTTSEKGSSAQTRSSQGCSWAPRQPKSHEAPERPV